eukprot:gb/GEZN01003391.1/.p1 GENE.gb/GEZN01003391.1/~~gb/GEZN01003391.1/.p1  ORF type:complete len:495 (+),score=57.91 gb/GEZN01003391.1/:93-1577(+)
MAHRVVGQDKALSEYLKEEELFLETIDEDLICTVCSHIFQDPYAICANEHILCQACLNDLKKMPNPKCPSCRSPLLPEPIRSRSTGKLIDKLRLKCPNHQRTCDWTGRTSQLLAHQAVCAFQLISCPYESEVYAKHTVLRKELKEHVGACPSRPVKCLLGCDSFIIARDQRKHQEENCALRHVTCRQEGCNSSFRFFESVKHLTECQFLQVPCIFQPLGCPVELNRRDLVPHLQEALVAHSKLVAQLPAQILELQQRCAFLESIQEFSDEVVSFIPAADSEMVPRVVKVRIPLVATVRLLKQELGRQLAIDAAELLLAFKVGTENMELIRMDTEKIDFSKRKYVCYHLPEVSVEEKKNNYYLITLYPHYMINDNKFSRIGFPLIVPLQKIFINAYPQVLLREILRQAMAKYMVGGWRMGEDDCDTYILDMMDIQGKCYDEIELTKENKALNLIHRVRNMRHSDDFAIGLFFKVGKKARYLDYGLGDKFAFFPSW